MAEPTMFPQANMLLGRPASMTEDECASLPVFRCEQPRVFISRWQPTVDDLERLVRGEPIWIHVYGDGHPPVAVSTEDPWREPPETIEGYRNPSRSEGGSRKQEPRG